MNHPRDSLHLIGWKERVDFVDWGIRRVRAKVDTGARTSAIGVDRCELHESSDTGLVAELHLALNARHRDRSVVVRVPVLKLVMVCNSSGTREQRPLIETRLRIGPVTKRVLLTVTCRAGMRFPMILGRTALAGDFVVDVGQKNLLRRVKTPRGQ